MTKILRRSLLPTPALLTALGPSLAEAQAAQPLRTAMSIGDLVESLPPDTIPSLRTARFQ